MTDHSPDHAERARIAGHVCGIAAIIRAFPDAEVWGGAQWAEEAAATLDRAAAALRGRDTLAEADVSALDAILLRWRLNSDAARPSVKLGLLRRLRAALGERP